MIRPATVQDLPRLAELGRSFFQEGRLPGELIDEVFVASWTNFLNTGPGIIFVAEEEGVVVGAIGALHYKDINDGKWMVTETFWFLDKAARGGGIRLLNALEEEAKRRGAARMTMVHLKSLSPEILEKIYCRKGYTPVEVHYVRTL